MATSLKTPGFYVREFTRKAVVDQVPSAVPAFVGYTQIAQSTLEAVTVRTMDEFISIFGGAPAPDRQVKLDANNIPANIQATYNLYSCMEAYFANGGSECFVVSAGDFSSAPALTPLSNAVDILKRVEEVTILCVPDIVGLTSASDISTLNQKLLTECASTGDRFAVLDVPYSTNYNQDLVDFRTNIGLNNLTYGAAYGPQVTSTQSVEIGYENIATNLIDSADNAVTLGTGGTNTIANTGIDKIKTLLADVSGVVDVTLAVPNEASMNSYNEVYEANTTGSDQYQTNRKVGVIIWMVHDMTEMVVSQQSPEFISDPNLISYVESITKVGGELYHLIRTLKSYVEGWTALTALTNSQFDGQTHPEPLLQYNADYDYDLGNGITPNSSIYGPPGGTDEEKRINSAPYFEDIYFRVLNLFESIRTKAQSILAGYETELENTNAEYKTIIDAVRSRGLTIPASAYGVAAMVSTDRESGVWHAPANLELEGVVGPIIPVSHGLQADMNVDVTAGKSVNAVRAMTGRGIRIWGARTLAGNDLEWRYISVRRLYLTVQKSLKQTLEAFVFETNDANTWLRVRSLTDQYLRSLWTQGALVGESPEEAYQIGVGLNESMTAADVLDGQLIVNIGLAAVRPAEFIEMKLVYQVEQ